jgi:hypothetical protein
VVGRLSMATRREVVAAIRGRYGAATRAEKARVLDELVAVAGYHRKHAIRVLGRREAAVTPDRARRGRVYGEDDRATLIALWEASDRLCSKRLKPLIPVLLPALERHGRVQLDDEARARLLAVSPATMDRLLSEVRVIARGGRRRRAGFSSAVRRTVPVRTFGDWNDPPPGYVEVDLVAHGGTSVAGSFVQTVVLTDVATGWTECVPILVRESALVLEALERARTLFPFPLKGVDFDNDSAFMNELVIAWCREQGLEVTRARAYRKNDQAWVEQKNGAIVRRLVGYGRLEGLLAAEGLARLYAASRLHGNLLQPSFKLRQKTRKGARVIKRYHAPEPPVARALAHPALDAMAKDRLRTLRQRCDPVVLLSEIRAAQAELGTRVDRRGTAAVRDAAPAPVEVDRFVASLKTAWREGEQRATHRRAYRRRKPVPKRGSMLDPVRDEFHGWLEVEPGLSAKDVLARLQAQAPERFQDTQLRTVQRAVKAWRAQSARAIILGARAALTSLMPVDLMDEPSASPTAPQRHHHNHRRDHCNGQPNEPTRARARRHDLPGNITT